MVSAVLIAYTVTCTFADDEIARTYVDWMHHTHIADVIAAGAESAEVVTFEGSCEVRYRFSSREALDVYVREHAPRLRAEGLAQAKGRVTFTRTVGEIVARLP